ncbi:SYF2 splicing factor-domain-containing protein [Chytridium lagenaria]|nr:SYF2 splicing factor-domain-containing protein [Chytridium lagenaria]
MPPKSRKSISSKPVDTPSRRKSRSQKPNSDEETSPPPLPSTIVDTPLRRRKSTRGGKAEVENKDAVEPDREVEDKDDEELEDGKKRKAPASARKTVKRGRKEEDKEEEDEVTKREGGTPAKNLGRKRTRKDVDEEEEKADEDEGEGESDAMKDGANEDRKEDEAEERSTDEPMAVDADAEKSTDDVPEEETNGAQSEDAHEADDSDATRTENRKDVYTEFQAQKKNPRDEIRQDRLKRAADILQQKQHAEENGLDYDRIRAMTYSVQDVERYEKKERQRAKKADKDQKRTAEELGTRVGGESDGFYRDANSLAYAAQAKPNPKAVEKLVKIVEKDAEKRKTFSRRRRHNEDDDVTYINERNMRFNRKIARAYDKHTADIRAAFERGTAL